MQAPLKTQNLTLSMKALGSLWQENLFPTPLPLEHLIGLSAAYKRRGSKTAEYWDLQTEGIRLMFQKMRPCPGAGKELNPRAARRSAYRV